MQIVEEQAVTSEQVGQLYVDYVKALDVLIFHQIEAKRTSVPGSQEALETERRSVDETYQKYYEAEKAFIFAGVKRGV